MEKFCVLCISGEHEASEHEGGKKMVPQSIQVNGRRVRFEWHPDTTGTTGLVAGLPGVMDFRSESLDDARDTVRSLFDKTANA